MKYLLIIVASTLLAATMSHVEATAEAVSAPTVTANTTDTKTSGKICRRTERVGTRLGSKKVCMTSEEWANTAREARDALDKQQSHGITRGE
jgi:Ni/Co efflux regulator RcnB